MKRHVFILEEMVGALPSKQTSLTSLSSENDNYNNTALLYRYTLIEGDITYRH